MSKLSETTRRVGLTGQYAASNLRIRLHHRFGGYCADLERSDGRIIDEGTTDWRTISDAVRCARMRAERLHADGLTLVGATEIPVEKYEASDG